VNDVARGPLNEALRGPIKVGGLGCSLVSLVVNPALPVPVPVHLCF